MNSTMSGFPGVEAFTTFGQIILVLLAAGTIVFFSSVFLLFLFSALVSRKSSEYTTDTRSIFLSMSTFAASLLAPIVYLLNTSRQAALWLASMLWASKSYLIPAAIFFTVSILWTVYNTFFWEAFAVVYSFSIVPLFRGTVLWFVLIYRWLIETFVPITNNVLIRWPSAVVYGVFFDVTTCSVDSWQALGEGLVAVGTSLSGTASPPVGIIGYVETFPSPPNFVPFGQSIAGLFTVFQLFLRCVCSSGHVITDPLFAAIVDGSPVRPADEPPSFACAINATINVPIVAITDIVSPIVYGIQQNKYVAPNFNGTFDTAFTWLNCTAGIADDIIQQYAATFISLGTFTPLTTDGTDTFPLPPRIVSCVVPWLWAGGPDIVRIFRIFLAPGPTTFKIITKSPIFWKWAFNIIWNVDKVFTGWNGQLFWRIDDYYDAWASIFTCICSAIRWVGECLAFAADHLAGEDASVCEIGNGIGVDVGVCILKIVQALFDTYCCFTESAIAFLFSLEKIIWNTAVGTIYTIVVRAFVENTAASECFPPGGPANILPKYRDFCTVPRPPFFFNSYLYFQWGDRTDLHDGKFCDADFCDALFQCDNDGQCNGLFVEDAAAICDTQLTHRCLVNEHAGQVCPPNSESQPCIFVNPTTDDCSFSYCHSTSPEIPFECFPIGDDHSCDCQCSRNEFRIMLANNLLEFVECIGKFLQIAFGPDLNTASCFITQSARVVINLLLLIVDFIVHIDTFLRLGANPAPVNIDPEPFIQSLRDWVQCGADGILTATITERFSLAMHVIKADSSDVALMQMSEAWESLGNAAIDIGNGIIGLILEVFFAIKEGRAVDNEAFYNAMKLGIKNFIIAIGALLKGLGAFIAFGLGPTFGQGFGVVFSVIGDIFIEIAEFLACTFIDAFSFIANCIIGFIVLIVTIGTGEPQADLFLECLAEIGFFFLELLGLVCTVDDVICLFTGEQIFPEDCTYEDSLCYPSNNIFCIINDAICFINPFSDEPVIDRDGCEPYAFCNNEEFETCDDLDSICADALDDAVFDFVLDDKYAHCCQDKYVRCKIPSCWDLRFYDRFQSQSGGCFSIPYITFPNECKNLPKIRGICADEGGQCEYAKANDIAYTVPIDTSFCCTLGYRSSLDHYTFSFNDTVCAASPCHSSSTDYSLGACSPYGSSNFSRPQLANICYTDANLTLRNESLLEYECSLYTFRINLQLGFILSGFADYNDPDVIESYIPECCGGNGVFQTSPAVYCDSVGPQVWDVQLQPYSKFCWASGLPRPACQPPFDSTTDVLQIDENILHLFVDPTNTTKRTVLSIVSLLETALQKINETITLKSTFPQELTQQKLTINSLIDVSTLPQDLNASHDVYNLCLNSLTKNRNEIWTSSGVFMRRGYNGFIFDTCATMFFNNVATLMTNNSASLDTFTRREFIQSAGTVLTKGIGKLFLDLITERKSKHIIVSGLPSPNSASSMAGAGKPSFESGLITRVLRAQANKPERLGLLVRKMSTALRPHVQYMIAAVRDKVYISANIAKRSIVTIAKTLPQLAERATPMISRPQSLIQQSKRQEPMLLSHLPENACPKDSICNFPKCSDNSDCPDAGTSCSSTLKRCIYAGTTGCLLGGEAATGAKCVFIDAGSVCSMGNCSAGVCTPIPSQSEFDCGCECVCTPSGAPFECCESQTVCLNCSYVDRIIFAFEDSGKTISNYYANDYLERFTPCLQQAIDTRHYMRVYDEEQCPKEFCNLPECERDEDCIGPVGQEPAAVCNPLLHRCVRENQCAGTATDLYDGDACITHPIPGLCRLGACIGNGTCSISGIVAPCGCKCPDTFLTVNKTVPFILSRLTTIQWPWTWNYTDLAHRISPDSALATGNFSANNPFRGSVETAKRCNDTTAFNIQCAIIVMLNGISDGAGTTFIGWLEDVAYVIVNFFSAGDAETEVFTNFLNELVFCDYNASYYCPLSDDSLTVGTGCCNDRCETRLQGIGLFDGFIVALLFILLPFAICSFIPCCSALQGLSGIVVALVLYPFGMAIAYGGGILCYSNGPYLLIVPLMTFFLRQISKCLKLCRCKMLGKVCGFVCGGLAAGLAFLSVLPALSVCVGMDGYNLVSELVPPCFPVPTTLINRTEQGSLQPCGVFLGLTEEASNVTFPSIIDCGTTTALGDTQFRDGLDNILYIAEWISPGSNANLSNSSIGTAIPFIGKRAEKHTTAAHASGQPLTDTCFWITLPSIVADLGYVIFAAGLIVILSAAALFILAMAILPFFMCGYGTWLAWHQLKLVWIWQMEPSSPQQQEPMLTEAELERKIK